MNLGNDNILGW